MRSSIKAVVLGLAVGLLTISSASLADDKFELNQGNFTSIKLPSAGGFFDDDRKTIEKAFWKATVCMIDCKPKAEVLNRARNVNVAPETKGGSKVEWSLAIDPYMTS